MNRRTFLAGAAAVTLNQADAAPMMPVIDCHIHLFDVNRPQGVPWPAKTDAIYKTALPDRYRKIATPFGIVGAIEVEASPWLEDNQWVLDVAAKDKIIVGTVGDLEPDKADFRKQLDRFHKNPLFRGIRYGNLWDRDFTANISKPEMIAGLKAIADADLVMDSANPDPKLIRDLVRLTDKVPTLRVVVDHLARLEKPNRSRCTEGLCGGSARTGQEAAGLLQGIRRCAPRQRQGARRSGLLYGRHRRAMGCVWRRPAGLRQRLAEQRPVGGIPC